MRLQKLSVTSGQLSEGQTQLFVLSKTVQVQQPAHQSPAVNSPWPTTSDFHVIIPPCHVRMSDFYVRLSECHVRLTPCHGRLSDWHVRLSLWNGLIQVKEEGWTGFSKGWQGCSEGLPEGKAQAKSRGAALQARGKPCPS